MSGHYPPSNTPSASNASDAATALEAAEPYVLEPLQRHVPLTINDVVPSLTVPVPSLGITNEEFPYTMTDTSSSFLILTSKNDSFSTQEYYFSEEIQSPNLCYSVYVIHITAEAIGWPNPFPTTIFVPFTRNDQPAR